METGAKPADKSVTLNLFHALLQTHSTTILPPPSSSAFPPLPLPSSSSSSSAGGGGVLSSVWNLRSTVRHMQNLLDGYLSYAESWKNLLNWTHPQKVRPPSLAPTLTPFP